jgi:transposase
LTNKREKGSAPNRLARLHNLFDIAFCNLCLIATSKYQHSSTTTSQNQIVGPFTKLVCSSNPFYRSAMAPCLRPEVIAAIEIAVELNEGSLESAYIHALAKIYKTSPQAVVYNMKRYNKVKNNCDDRKKTGRHAVMDKDLAAEFMKELLAEMPGLRLEKLQQKVVERFGIHVSTSWVSRLCQRYGVVYKNPKPPRVKKVRIPQPSKPVKQPRQPKPTKPAKPLPPPPFSNFIVTTPGSTPQYPLPPYQPQYPAFRQELQQALTAPPANLPPAPRQLVAPPGVPLPPVYAPPPPSASPPVAAPPFVPRPVPAPRDDGEHNPGFLFDMLKPSNWPLKPGSPTSSAPRPAVNTQYSHPPQYQYPPSPYPPHPGHPPTATTTSDAPTQSQGTSSPSQSQPSSSTSAKSSDVVWEVLKVVECG